VKLNPRLILLEPGAKI